MRRFAVFFFIVFGVFLMIVTYFKQGTRHRLIIPHKLMADAGCVELMRDNEPMARALLKISDDHEEHAEHYEKEYGETPHEQVRQASYLYDPSDIDPVKSLSS